MSDPVNDMMNDGIFYKEIKDTFVKFNYSWRSLFSNEPKERLRGNEYVNVDNGQSDFERFVEFNDTNRFRNKVRQDKRIGIVNWKGDEKNIEDSLKGIPNKSKDRRNALFEVLNYAIRKKVEILVFPELSIPFEWFPLLVEQASKHDIAIIGGLEYFISPNNHKTKPESIDCSNTYFKHTNPNAYNLLFGFFPITMMFYRSAFPLFRVKNYYSPGEVEQVVGYHLTVPQPDQPKYHLIHWRNIYMSLYNCFELSDLSDRALFKSRVDIITAVEFNKDTSYFSNVVESWARDLHCFILQANPSDFGDSRIIQPTKSETRDVVRVKGGMYPIVLVGELKIDSLRQHQLKDHNLQLLDKSYKPTPARFLWKLAKARIDNISLFAPPFSKEEELIIDNKKNSKNQLSKSKKSKKQKK